MGVERFALKQGDTAPPLVAVLLYSDGTAPNLVGATATFAMRDSMGTVVISETTATVDAAAGTVSYAWQSGDTNTVGFYHGEFTVTLLSGRIETFPSEFYIEVQIQSAIGGGALVLDGSWILDGTYALTGHRLPI